MTVQELIDLLSTVEDKDKEVIIVSNGAVTNLCSCFESKDYVRLIEADGDVEVELL